jgi:hypothetical protein
MYLSEVWSVQTICITKNWILIYEEFAWKYSLSIVLNNCMNPGVYSTGLTRGLCLCKQIILTNWCNDSKSNKNYQKVQLLSHHLLCYKRFLQLILQSIITNSDWCCLEIFAWKGTMAYKQSFQLLASFQIRSSVLWHLNLHPIIPSVLFLLPCTGNMLPYSCRMFLRHMTFGDQQFPSQYTSCMFYVRLFSTFSWVV